MFKDAQLEISAEQRKTNQLAPPPPPPSKPNQIGFHNPEPKKLKLVDCKENVRIASLNTAGDKIDEVIKYMYKCKIDILCAQETINMDNSSFNRDGIFIITASDLSFQDKEKLENEEEKEQGEEEK